MNYTDYLLACASEECIEVSKELHKSLRFGLTDINPDDKEQKPNKLNVALELVDLISVIELLKEEQIFDLENILIANNYEMKTLIAEKKLKVKKFYQYSKQNIQ